MSLSPKLAREPVELCTWSEVTLTEGSSFSRQTLSTLRILKISLMSANTLFIPWLNVSSSLVVFVTYLKIL